MELKGSRTEASLRRAFAGEARCLCKYALFAEAARREGYEQLAALFDETAQNELAHARMWLAALGGVQSAAENLADAVADENAMWTSAYPEMARIARAEGFSELASQFQGAARTERAHEVRFLALLENLRRARAFSRDAPVLWHCRNCGHLEWGRRAPASCPVCGRPQGFFQIRAENF